MNRWMLPGVAATALALAGCGDFRLNQMVAKYREQCFGSVTNECIEKRVEVNIAFAEEYLDRMESERDRIVAEIGEEGFSELEWRTRRIIALNEKDLPGWFPRWFMGEAQSMKAPDFDFSNALFIRRDYLMQYDNILENYQARSGPANSEQGPNIPGHADQLKILIEEHIAQHAEEDGASEYTEARLTEIGDFDEDGNPDLALVYTLEGAGGGNNSYQVLIVIAGGTEAYEVTDERVLEGAITELGSDAGQLVATSMSHAPDDPSCCPSLREVQAYRLADGKLVAQPEHVNLKWTAL